MVRNGQLCLEQSDSKIFETVITPKKFELLSSFYTYVYASIGVKNQCIFVEGYAKA